jgi:hypothetical protein
LGPDGAKVPQPLDTGFQPPVQLPPLRCIGLLRHNLGNSGSRPCSL